MLVCIRSRIPRMIVVHTLIYLTFSEINNGNDDIFQWWGIMDQNRNCSELLTSCVVQQPIPELAWSESHSVSQFASQYTRGYIHLRDLLLAKAEKLTYGRILHTIMIKRKHYLTSWFFLSSNHSRIWVFASATFSHSCRSINMLQVQVYQRLRTWSLWWC